MLTLNDRLFKKKKTLNDRGSLGAMPDVEDRQKLESVRTGSSDFAIVFGSIFSIFIFLRVEQIIWLLG